MPVKNRMFRRIAMILVLLGLISLGAWGVALGRAANRMLNELRRLEALAQQAPEDIDVASISMSLHTLQREMTFLHHNLSWTDAITPLVVWVPRYGPLVAQGPALLDVGNALSELGVLLWDDVLPVVQQYQQGASWQALLPGALSALAQDHTRKEILVKQALDGYARVDVSSLPSDMRPRFTQLGSGLYLLQNLLALSEVAPTLLGFNGEQTYLVLALNEDELRPAGGFISGVGEVRILDGDPVSMIFRDSYAVDDYSQPYPDPPAAMRQFLGLDLWVFRDSGWSPHFPDAAEQAIALYRPGYPVEVAGVISIDQWAVQRLVSAVGPLKVAGREEPITGADVLRFMREAWAPDDGTLDREWWRQRKQFMGEIADATMERFRSGEIDMMALAKTVLSLLEQRHCQIYVRDPVAAAVLAELGWDGGLRHAAGDFLMLVDANVGYNKVSMNVERTFLYEVDLEEERPFAQLTLEYRHASQQEIPCTPEIRYDPVYDAMRERCYWAYLRIVVPADSALVDATRHPIPGSQVFSGSPWPGDVVTETVHDRLGYAQALLLPTRSTQVLKFSYHLPAEVVVQGGEHLRSYTLLIQKQAGVRRLMGQVILHLPPGAVVLRTQPECEEPVASVVSCRLDAAGDIEVRVSYSLKED